MRIISNYGPTIKAFYVEVDGEKWLVTQYFSLLAEKLPWITFGFYPRHEVFEVPIRRRLSNDDHKG